MIRVQIDQPIMQLLSAAQLPIADLINESITELFAQFHDATPVGVIGLERHGKFGLLRSLAVAKAAQKKGIATQLIRDLETYAASTGIGELYLLTTTASRLFETLGYTQLERAFVPGSIVATKQYSGLCPSTAIVLGKKLIHVQSPV